MPIVQVVAAARVVPQVPPDLANGEVTTTAMPVAPAPPVLVSVRFCTALVVPCTTPVKVSVVGVTVSNATAGAWNSTAPASTARLVFLGLPKKSNDGAAA